MANESLVFDILARDGASPSLQKVGDAALEASGSMKELSDKLKDVNGRTAAARVKLDGDKEAQAELDKLDVKLLRLGKAVANPNVRLDGVARARADISGLDLALDRLDAKHATATVGVSGGGGRGGILGRLAGLFGGGGGGGGGAAASGASGAGSLLLGNPVGQGALVGGGLLALGSVPGLVGLGLGGGVGLGAIAGGIFGASEGTKILKADTANITQITTALKTAVGKQKTQLSAALKDANKQYAKDSAFYAPFLGFQKSLKDLAQNFLKPLQPIMAPLTKIIEQFGKGLSALAPQFTALFKASLPFIQQFAQVMLQSGKILLPAFTQALQTMVKSGALKEMTQGLVYLVQGFAGFVKALGPGMKASGQIFERIMLFVKDLLIGLGKTVSFIANLLETNWGAAVKRMWHDTVTAFDAMRHDVASIFDRVRHDIAAAWGSIWNDTVGRVRSGISTVTGWFRKLPGMALGALAGLGHSLYAFAHSAMDELWSGFKSVGGAIVSWIKGFGSRIISGLKGLFGIHSPSSVFHGIGENLMHGLLNGLKAGHGKVGSFLHSNVAGTLMGGVQGAFSSSAAAAQKYAASLLSMYGWSQRQMSDLIPLWNQESGWNAYAVNPSSGAYGIPQSLGHGHPYALGDYKNQVVWGLNYIRERYGSPAGAWAHEQAYNWYGNGLDAIISKPTLIGVGERGPEHVQVTPRGRSGGGGASTIILDIRLGGAKVGHAIIDVVQKHVEVTGGGDVQVALGSVH